MKIRRLESPNYNNRVDGAKPDSAILHSTGAGAVASRRVYMQKDSVSPHYMIERNGKVTQFVDEKNRAWHAGQSWWDGEMDMNNYSIGIELVNPGPTKRYIPFTPAQMEALANLLGGASGILARYKIPAHRVLGHSDVSPDPTRKRPDPGELMDWFWLAQRGIGLYPQPTQEDYDLSAKTLNTPESLRAAFTAYGYDPRENIASFTDIITAFQRHFQPEAHFEKRAGIPDKDTAARLHWLLNAKNSYKP